MDVISDKYNDFEISYRLREIYDKNSQNSKNRLNYLKSLVYSSSDKSATDIICSYLKYEIDNGSKLDAISNNIELIKRSGASKEISDVCMEILSDSLNYSSRGEDKVTQILYSQNLNMLKYEMILGGV